MIRRCMETSTLLLFSALLSGCSVLFPGGEPQPGFFERTDPGGARCYAGTAIPQGEAAGDARHSVGTRTVHIVLDDIKAHGGRAAHIVREQSTRPVGATWAMVGDSLLVEQWGVMPTTDYLLHEHGGELSGRAWMEHDTANCFNGVCRGPRTSHWAIQARRIPCSEVPRDRTATLQPVG